MTATYDFRFTWDTKENQFYFVDAKYIEFDSIAIFLHVMFQSHQPQKKYPFWTKPFMQKWVFW